MTPEQKERIQKAARELSAALTDAGDDFYVSVGQHAVTAMGDHFWRYVYNVSVEATTREVIA